MPTPRVNQELKKLFAAKNIFLPGLFFLLGIPLSAAQTLLPHSHAHNDYLQQRPLLDALDQGFASIEIDVFSHRQKIRVAHYATKLKKKPTLEELYLKPLVKIIEQNGGTVYAGDSTPLIMMIDLKKDKVELYHLLVKQFAVYESFLEIPRGENQKWGPLRIILSGRPPLDLVLEDSLNYFSVDGFLDNLQTDLDAKVQPRASANFKKLVNWDKSGKLSEADEYKLKTYIQTAHSQGIKTRLWATPDDPILWEKLLDLGIDWINVDDLQAFRLFMEKRNQ